MNPGVAGVIELYAEAEDQLGAVRRVGPVTISVNPVLDQAPIATVTGPLDGQFLGTSGSSFVAIPLTAKATDDKTISQLDFVIAPWPGSTGQVVVAGGTPQPSGVYRDTWTTNASWTPNAAGRFVVRARARDGIGRPTVDSAPIEIYVDNLAGDFAPRVRIALPSIDDEVRVGQTMPITINVRDGINEFNIRSVHLYLDGSSVAFANINGPGSELNEWSVTHNLLITSELALGTHTLVARAKDETPWSAQPRGDSTPVAFRVVAASTDSPPSGVITLPTGITSLSVGTATTLNVRARDLNVDGGISSIEIFANGLRISPTSPALPLSSVPGRSNEKTTSMSWTPSVSGDYDLVARVTDNANQSADSIPLKIRVAGISGNAAPTVELIEPENGAYLELGSGTSVALRALVSDPGAALGATPGVSRVEFLNGNTLLGTVTAGLPSGTTQTAVTFQWLNPPEGGAALTARAIDTQGAAKTSLPRNLFVLGAPPQVSLLSPVPNQPGFVAPETIHATVDVADDSDVISKVQYYLNGSFHGESTAEPFDYFFRDVPAGNFTLTAKAFDGSNKSSWSAPVSINVAANQSPTIRFTSPLTTNPPGQFGEGQNIPMTVIANDPDEGRIEKVEFFSNGQLIQSARTPPFNATWLSAGPGGTANLTAKVTDQRGAFGVTSEASVIAIVAAAPPVVSLATPTAGSTHYIGDSVPLSANASDPDQGLGGRILSVQFFKQPVGSPQSATAIGVPITAAPYALDWSPSAQHQGTFQIFARAIDSGPAGRNTTDSSPRTITVLQNSAPTSVTLLSPAMPSHYRTDINALGSQTVLAPNGVLHLSASSEDGESNVERVEFYLQRADTSVRHLLKTVSRTTAGQTVFTGDAQLPAGWDTQGIVYVHAKAIDSRDASVQTEIEDYFDPSPDPESADT